MADTDNQKMLKTWQLMKIVQACQEAMGPTLPLKGCTDQPLRLPADAQEAERHLAWMCEQIQPMLEQEKYDKAHRWIGFIQGCLWVLGLRTIDQMREDNRTEPVA